VTAPQFGTNPVGGSAAPCPLANLKVTVKQRADGAAPGCALKVVLGGTKLMEGPLPKGTKDVEFQHIPAGPYTVRIEADEPFILHYEVPDSV